MPHTSQTYTQQHNLIKKLFSEENKVPRLLIEGQGQSMKLHFKCFIVGGPLIQEASSVLTNWRGVAGFKSCVGVSLQSCQGHV